MNFRPGDSPARRLAADRKARGGRQPLVTRPLLVRFVSISGASMSFYLLLSVVPLYGGSAGGKARPGWPPAR
jgi:hypothetical protein